MAKRLNLQEYQENILSRLKALADSSDSGSTSRLGIQVGDSAWLVSLQDVGEVLPVPEIQPVPLTRPWFMGVSNVRGNLYAVTDLSSFLGGRPARITADSRLLLAGSRFGVNSAFLIDRLYGLRSVADMHPKEASGSATGWEASVYWDASAMEWRELDVAKLLNSTAFMQVAA